jgi:hypothetical protein
MCSSPHLLTIPDESLLVISPHLVDDLKILCCLHSPPYDISITPSVLLTSLMIWRFLLKTHSSFLYCKERFWLTMPPVVYFHPENLRENGV